MKARYKIEVKVSAKKELRKVAKEYLIKIIKEIDKLAGNPFPDNSIKLSSQGKYRLRIGKYRVLYSVQKKPLTIFVVKVAHRKSVYK